MVAVYIDRQVPNIPPLDKYPDIVTRRSEQACKRKINRGQVSGRIVVVSPCLWRVLEMGAGMPLVERCPVLAWGGGVKGSAATL